MNLNTVIRATVGTAAAALCGLAGLVAAMGVGKGELVIAGLAAGVAAGSACVLLKMLERSGLRLNVAEWKGTFNPINGQFVDELDGNFAGQAFNPATGLPMIGGVDAAGNLLGTNRLSSPPPAA